LKIGYVHKGYNEDRNIINSSSKVHLYLKVFDLYKLRDFIYFKRFKKTNHSLHNSFDDRFSYSKADVYHFFNGVNFGDKPWISTFEGILPRFGNNKIMERKAIKAILKSNCKQLIAFSEFNYQMQLSFIQREYPEAFDIIKSKTQIILPPQDTSQFINHDRFNNIQTLKLLFVGHDFFRKGGREVFNVVENLVKKGHKVELTIVSKLQSDNFITDTSSKDSELWRNKIKQVTFCKYHQQLPSNDINILMRESHLLLIPSLQDTFGYVVLEAQSNGLPVVSTSIRAFPEINNDSCGYLINIPQTDKGFADVYSNGYDVISDKLSREITEILTSVLANSNELLMKSENSVKRILAHHNPKEFFRKIDLIYANALAN
jgi:glycosyltransferase involved in cell wall biosynthesis